MIYLIAFVFIVLDFVTGIIKGAATGTFSSTIMREGLYKKLGLILCMALSYAVDYAQAYIDLGISVPVAAMVCSYIGAMEIASALENICEINPDIMPERLTALFGSTVVIGTTDEQDATATVSEAVTAIMEGLNAAMKTTTEQDDKTAAGTIGATEAEALNDAWV